MAQIPVLWTLKSISGRVDASSALTRLQNWLQNRNDLPAYDHAMLFTGSVSTGSHYCSQGQSPYAASAVHSVILHMQPCCSHGQSLQAAITVHTVSLYSQCCSQGQSLQAASDVHRVSLYRQPVLFTGSVSIGSQCSPTFGAASLLPESTARISCALHYRVF